MTIKKGFTLIELLVVIGIMAVLAAGVVALINPVEKNRQALDSNSQNAIGQIATALQTYAATSPTGMYPATLNALTPTELISIPTFPQGVTTWNYQGGGTATVSINANMQSAKNQALGAQWCWRSATGNAGFTATCNP